MKRSILRSSVDGNSSNNALRALKAQRHQNQSTRSWAKYKSKVYGMFNDLVVDWRDTFENPSMGSDFSAGITVAAVAIPLNLALAIAAGLPPVVGIISGAVGGIVSAIFGGSRWQVTGPAAALNVMVAAIVVNHGPAAAAAASLFVGVIQIGLCLAFAGRLMDFMPEAVLAGFITGVGLKLLDKQIPKLLGVEDEVSHMITNLHDPLWLHDVSWFSVLSGLLVIVTMLALMKFRRLPSALAGLILATVISSYLKWDLHRVGEIPNFLPDVMWPHLSLETWGSVLIASIPLGLLGAAETLLAARGLDMLTKNAKPHQPNLELFGQGMASLAVGWIGGMPVTGVIVRGTANVQSGGKTRISAIVHGFALICAILFAGKILGTVPVAALAGLLCVVGVRLVEYDVLFHLIKENKIHAMAFVIAVLGPVTDFLVISLLASLALCWLGYLLDGKKRHQDKSKAALRTVGVRAIIEASGQEEQGRPKPYSPGTRNEQWGKHVTDHPQVASTAFIHPNASVIGRVVIDQRVHVAAEAALRADEGTPFYIGPDTNIQDGVVLHALKEKWVQVNGNSWAIYVGKQVSMAHQALIHGPCYIGDHSFIGFKAVVHDATIGSNCFVGIGAVVVGVELPNDRFVPHGMIVDTQEKVNSLPMVKPEQMHFNADVVEVNQGLAEAYRAVDEGDPFSEKNIKIFAERQPLRDQEIQAYRLKQKNF